MKVKNDFPAVDRVLSKLRELVKVSEDKINKNLPDAKLAKLALDYVDEFIESIGNYLDAVCNTEDRIAKFKNSGADIGEIQEMISSEDAKRTSYHSKIIMTMVMIDRISEKLGVQKVFDYAEEFQGDASRLTPSTAEEKAKMTERERIKRREMGNFGLYIAASVTAGMSREYMISDDEARQFASCEGDTVEVAPVIMKKVKLGSKGLKNNMDNIIM